MKGAKKTDQIPEADSQYENLCRRCGACCYQKVRTDDGEVIITDVPCEYLEVATNLCRVYPERFVKQPLCASARASAAMKCLPGTCPYTGGNADYREPVLLRERPELEEGVNEIFPERRGKR